MRDINLEDTIYPKFSTRAFATGIPTTLAGTPVLSIYEENNLTQITAGVSITADYDSVTGLNQAAIVATAANGYEAGKSYDLVITTGTVGGVSVVGEVVYSFTIEDSAAATDLANGTDGLTALKTAVDSRMAEASIDTTAGAVDNVTLVATTTTNSDMRGTDDAATEAKQDIIDTNVDTLLTRIIGTLATGTHNPATAAQIAVLSDLIDGGRLDLILDIIAADTTTDIPALINALNNLSLVDIFSEPLTKSTYNVGQSLAKIVRELGSWNSAEGVVTGTPTTTVIATNITGYDTDFFRDQGFWAYNGAAQAGQSRIVTAYNTDGTFTFDEPFTTALIAGDDVVIATPHVHNITEISEQVRAEMDANSTQLNTTLPALIDDLAIKKNTAGLLHVEMVLASDHVTPATGLTVTVQRLIDSGVYASVAGTMAEISNGTYRFNYLEADSNGDIISWKFSAATADDTKLTFKTVA